MALQHLRSGTANKRANPAAMADGQLAMNTNSTSPGLFLKDGAGNLVKVGPVHVGTSAPNASPASGGTAGNSVGEQWLDTSGSTYVFKIWDGSAWRSEAGEFVNATGDTMTGALVMDNQQQVRFRETTANGTNFIALQAPASVASDKTITLPDVTGTVVTTGDTGTVTSTMLLDGTIVNADVNASAAIAGTKISPDFGSQTVQTTGVFSAALGTALAPTVTFTGDTNTGLYSPGADQVAISTNGTGRLFVDASGNVSIGTSSGGYRLRVAGGVLIDNSSLNFSDGYAVAWGNTNIAGNNNGVLLFTTAGSERMRLDSSGRLGLGTSSPATLFHAAGPGLFRAALIGAPATLPTESSSVSILNGVSYGGTPSVSLNIGAHNYDAVNSNSTFQWRVTTPVTSGFAGARLDVNTYSFDGTSTYTTTPRATIDGSGRVGIGTSSPLYPLDVRAANAGSTTYINVDNTSATATSLAGIYFSQNGTPKHSITAATFGADYMAFNIGAGGSISERARIDSSGRLLVGTSNARSNYFNTFAPGQALQLQVEGIDYKTSGASFTSNNSTSVGDGPHIALGRSRGSSVGSNTIVNSGDSIGAIVFHGNDGTDFVQSARIEAYVDGTPGADDMPGRLVFSTTADGASSPTPRMTIDSSGRLLVGTSSAYAVASGFSGTNQQIVGNDPLAMLRYSADNSSTTVWINKSRNATQGIHTVVQSGDGLGRFNFGGSDGTNFITAARIDAEVDGTPATNDMPGRIVLSVTADGASSPSEALRITNDRVVAYNQPDVTSKAAAATLTVAELKTKIIQYTGAAATLTLPTGTLTEGGFSGIYTNMTFEWSVINTGSGLCTIGAGTGHTIVGGATVAAGASGRFASRRTAANTFVTYRLS